VIFVTVGTHGDPFDRLVLAAEALGRSGHRVVIQRGTSRVRAPSCVVHDFLSPAAMARHIREASIVVTHGGPASFLGVPGVPIVVPRSPAHGEHVDDHQLRFVTHIGHRAHVVLDPIDLPAAVRRHAEVSARLGVGADRRTEDFAKDFGAIVTEVVRRRRAMD